MNGPRPMYVTRTVFATKNGGYTRTTLWLSNFVTLVKKHVYINAHTPSGPHETQLENTVVCPEALGAKLLQEKRGQQLITV